MQEINELIKIWALDRNLIDYENRFKQLAKVTEELGEVSKAMQGQILSEMQGEIGDLLTATMILSYQCRIDPVNALKYAYEKIKTRKGKTIDGIFVYGKE